jgi:O-antigen ligase
VTAISGVALLTRNLPWLLPGATLALFATETLFQIPFWIMAGLGLYRLCRAPRAVMMLPGAPLAGALFLCLWVPQLASLPDAVNPARSMATALAYPHYFLAALYLLGAADDPLPGRRVDIAVLAIVTVWVVDAMIQYVSGTNLLGYAYRRGQLTGLFDPHMRIGHILAVLLPVCLDFTRRAALRRPWLWLLPVLMGAVIILSGKRVAWVMASVALLGYGMHLYRIRALGLRAVAAAILIATLGGAALLASNEVLARRAALVLEALSADATAVDRATSHRLPLWRTAVDIAGEHWINGVGPRGYRFAFRDFAGADHFYLKDGREGSTHPHQLVLEVAAETGAIGLAGLAAFWWLLATRGWRRYRDDAAVAPWLLAVLVAWLPLNAHLAFYGSYWSSIAWWVLMVLLIQPGTRAGDGPWPGS